MEKLKKCLLLPIDGSEEAIRPIEFLSRLYTGKRNINLILAYFQPPLPPVYQEAADSHFMVQKKRELLRLREERTRAAFERAKGVLIKSGFSAGEIQEHIQTSEMSVAQHACMLANIKKVDTVVVQRKVSSNLEGFLRGDPTDSMVRHCIASPVWIYDGSIDVENADGVTVRRVEMVGPKVGQDLRQKALFAIYYALIFIAIYISGRFEMKWGTSAIMAGVLFAAVYFLQALGLPVVYLTIGALLITLGLCWYLKLPYALAAVLALIHDVLITIGLFAITGREFTLEVLAALLTIAGYSLNDTIVVFDRIRENIRKERKRDFKEVINSSINQTLSRTILTGGTTLLSLLFLYLFGGTVINDFAFAMLIGILTGTYSSIFVASPLLILYEDWTRRRQQPVRARRAPA